MGSIRSVLPAWAKGWTIVDRSKGLANAQHAAERAIDRMGVAFDRVATDHWRVTSGLADPTGLHILKIKGWYVVAEEAQEPYAPANG